MQERIPQQESWSWSDCRAESLESNVGGLAALANTKREELHREVLYRSSYGRTNSSLYPQNWYSERKLQIKFDRKSAALSHATVPMANCCLGTYITLSIDVDKVVS